MSLRIYPALLGLSNSLVYKKFRNSGVLEDSVQIKSNLRKKGKKKSLALINGQSRGWLLTGRTRGHLKASRLSLSLLLGLCCF